MSFFDINFVYTTLLCSVVSLIIFYWYNKYYNHYWKNKGISYEKPFSFLKFLYVIYTIKKPYHELEMEIYRKHVGYFGMYEMTTPAISVSDPELLKSILVKDFHIFNQRRDFTGTSDLFDNFLSVIKGEKWKRLRNIVSPAFTSGRLRAMMPQLGECTKRLSSNMIKSGEKGEPVDIKTLIGHFLMDATATVAFGTKLDSHNDPNNVFVTNAKKSFNFQLNWKVVLFMLAPKLSLKLGFGLGPFMFFSDLTKDIIERRKKNNEVHNDFLQMMVEHLEDSENKDPNRKVLNMKELVSQCILFFLGGFETVATAITLTLLNIATHPEVMEKVVEEVDNFWKTKTDIDAATAGEARYLEACIFETLRIFPPATRLERVPNEDYVLGDTGVTIPKDMVVGIPVYCIHHDEQFYPDPESFLPERFLPENSENLQTYAYLPFGQGPRNCIAVRFVHMEIKICLLYLFRDITFSPSPKTKNPPEFTKAAGFMQPKDVVLNVERRTAA